MSYASFLKNVPEILSQPTGIAALASLGIHGAIAFILPLMPVESAKSNKQAATPTKPIGLSELSSSEQSRIPQKLPNQPGVQSQLPPLPSQISGLPAQQQIPLNLNGAPTGLPPSPPLGSSSSLVLPGGSNSSAFTPLERASGLSIAGLPRGGSSVQRFRNDLFKTDTSRFSSAPTMSSRVTPELSLGRNNAASRNYNIGAGYSGQQLQASRPSGLSELPVSAPTNLPVYPPALPPTDMASPPMGNTGNYGNNYGNVSAAQPGNERVEPTGGQYIAPIDQNQTVGNQKFNLAAGTPLPTYQPQPGGPLDNLNRPTNIPGTSVAPTGGATQQNTDDKLSDARIFGDFKKEFPQGELRAPINLTMDTAKLDSNVKVSLVMDGENKIADLKLLGDAAKLPFPSQQAIRERLQQYFKENPTSTRGKGALFSFVVSPGSVNSTQLSNNNALQNNQTPLAAPTATTNNIFNRLSGTQPNANQAVTAPVVNNPTVNSSTNSSTNSPTNNINRTTNSTQLPVLPPSLPGPLKPAGGTLPQGQQTVLPKLPLQKPASTTDLPQTLRNVQPAPQVKPSIAARETQADNTTSQPSRNALVTKLRNTESSTDDSKMSVIEKLRKVKQERENANRENANP
ncbi:hypothetical protein DSM106972_010460 [Dulcicalothrix desertica PCC 7102]|uniref:Uncharacterized protein n=1 Tax=Dulcicalothrix desertica PCC 7102 TaxID=232991 RepID=A0A3S1DFI9_9CYAN|nr:hypothetical protein [Dulcicalothrix desertica]RUT08993.1 hypothetical protein DSM106972_010460 [Dulcicalothrix desertica PCC 7102]TWH49877.1 hypothetical protein CAL7102_04136 [Dulcicalothrix desertica PCC 7102]